MSTIFNSIIGASVTGGTYLTCLLVAGVCGLLTACTMQFRSHASKGFLISLIVLPMIVHTVITMVNGNVGTGVAVMGAFSLVRFRSVPGKARDIAAIFLTMTVGLACAAGYIGIAVIITALVCAVILVLTLIPMGSDNTMELHITIPESLRFAHAFDDLFDEYTRSHRLVKTRTTNMGSLYKLLYHIEMKDRNQMQELIDKLRCRNGNLEIAIAEMEEGSDVL